MRRYPEYKDSGIEWIGEIPEHWGTLRLKFTDEVVMGQSPNSDDYNDTQVGLPFLQGNADFTNQYPKPRIWCDTATKKACKDDVLLSVRAPVGAVNLADNEYGIGRGLCAIRSNSSSHKYLYYIALSITDELNSIATGSTYVAVTADEVRNVYVPSNSSDEQQAIADYLDAKTALIDELIGKKRRQIELLKEQQQAVINQAVTKGLDPNVEMRDSGIEWLGEIPKSWEIKRLKHISPSISVGLVINPSTYVDPDGTVPFLYGGNIDEYSIHIENARRITDDSNELIGKSRLYAGDLVVVRVGYPGVTAVIPEHLDGSNCASMMIVRKGEDFVSEFLCYCLNSNPMKACLPSSSLI